MTDNYPETYTKSSYNIIAETEEYTVVAEYTPLYRGVKHTEKRTKKRFGNSGKHTDKPT